MRQPAAAAAASLCQRRAVATAAASGCRLDGRGPLDHRPLSVQLARRSGVCQVRCGETRVTAAVTGTLVRPRASRPCEGVLLVRVDYSPAAAVAAVAVESQACLERLVERCVRESRCCDMEALCVQADRCVWQLVVTIGVVQSGDGGVAPAAVMAAVTALRHHRRPSVAVDGERVTVASRADIEPLPLALLHTPLLFCYGFVDAPHEQAEQEATSTAASGDANMGSMTDAGGDRDEDDEDDGWTMLADPDGVEESVMRGVLSVAVNQYGEVCVLHVAGCVSLRQSHVMRCTRLAVQRAVELSRQLKQLLQQDAERRSVPGGDWSASLGDIQQERVCTASGTVVQPQLVSQLPTAEEDEQDEEMASLDAKLSVYRTQTAVLEPVSRHVGLGGASKWFSDDEDDDQDQDGTGAASDNTEATSKDGRDKSAVKAEPIVDPLSEDEEETQTVLQPEEVYGFV